MFAPSNPARVLANGCPRATAYRSLTAPVFFRSGGRLPRRSDPKADVGCGCRSRLNSNASAKNPERCCAAFTLLELLIVVGIIGLLMVLIAPAFTYIKGGTDVTSAAYTIKGVLDTARTYAKANNTYTWVGFYEENVANPVSPNPDTPAVGRLIMSIVASKDGTTIYDPSSPGTIDPTRLTPVTK